MNRVVYVVALCICLSGCGKMYKTISYTDSGIQNIKLPFIKEYTGNGKSVLVFGSYHTNDTGDMEIDKIDSILNSYQPEVILYEGDYIEVGRTKGESIRQYFEMGYARWWAAQNGVKDINIEPPAKEKNKYLLRKFGTDKVLLATILGQNILYIIQHDKEAFDKMYPAYIRDIENEGVPLKAEQKSIAYFYKLYREFYKEEFNPSQFDYETVEIKFNKTELNKVNQESAAYRDQYMIGMIREYSKNYKKVYMQAGGRHALVWQPAMYHIVKP